MSEDRWLRRPTVWSFAVCYGLYAVLLALCYWSFWIWRSAAEVVLSYLLRRSPAFGWTYLSTTLLIGLVLFAVTIGGEGYLRHGVEAGRGALGEIVRRFARLSWPLVVAIAVAMALQELVLARLRV